MRSINIEGNAFRSSLTKDIIDEWIDAWFEFDDEWIFAITIAIAFWFANQIDI